MKFSEEEKAMWLEDWTQSGKSAWAYAKANGLNPQTFVKWTRTETEAKPCFVEVPAPTMPGTQCELEILIEKGEIKIHIPLTIGSGGLRTIIDALAGAA
jgi:transposase-like protein